MQPEAGVREAGPGEDGDAAPLCYGENIPPPFLPPPPPPPCSPKSEVEFLDHFRGLTSLEQIEICRFGFLPKCETVV